MQLVNITISDIVPLQEYGFFLFHSVFNSMDDDIVAVNMAVFLVLPGALLVSLDPFWEEYVRDTFFSVLCH
jgi:hypothetical protein